MRIVRGQRSVQRLVVGAAAQAQSVVLDGREDAPGRGRHTADLAVKAALVVEAVAVGAVHAFIDAAEQKRRVLPAGVRRVNPVGQSRVYKVRAVRHADELAAGIDVVAVGIHTGR